MSCIIAIANLKGGVGKTTTAITLGHGLALQGLRTLIVDTDPAGHVALSLGLKKSAGLYRFLVEAQPCKKVVQTARDHLDVIASDFSTEQAVRHLQLEPFHEQILARALADSRYDVILIDTPATFGEMHRQALLAAEFVIVPTQLDPMSLDGVVELLYLMQKIVDQGHALDYCLVPTIYDRATRLTAEEFERVIRKFGRHVWPPIPRDVRAREAPRFGQTVWEFCPQSISVRGFQVNGQRVGGYAEILKIVERMVHAKPESQSG